MEIKAKLMGSYLDFASRKLQIQLEAEQDVRAGLAEIGDKPLRVRIVRWREKRSLDANALMWHCIGEIAKAIHRDKWSVYFSMLRDYGKYTYILAKENAVESIKKQWRECEVVGEVDVNGQKAVQMLCYYGSSTYDSKEFSCLLDEIISEMKQMQLETPSSEEMRRSLEEWEKQKNGE